MEEVDRIIIVTLNQLGCDIEDVKTVSELSVDVIVGGVVRCLRLINSSVEIPLTLPENMAQRFRVATTVAEAVKATGYKGDIGYQSLLYPNEFDLRKILMFLLETLPRDNPVLSSETLSKRGILQQAVQEKTSASLGHCWVPSHCNVVKRKFSTRPPVVELGTSHTRHFMTEPTLFTEEAIESSDAYFMRTIPATFGLDNSIASHLSWNSLKLQKQNRQEKKLVGTEIPDLKLMISHNETLSDSVHDFSVKSVLSSAAKQNELNLDDRQLERNSPEMLHREVMDLSQQLRKLTTNLHRVKLHSEEYRSELLQEEKLVTEKEEELKRRERISSLLPDAAINILKIEMSLKNCEDKMLRLEQQWTDHREPLELQLQQLRFQLQEKQMEHNSKTEELIRMRDSMREMTQDGKRKEAAIAQLQERLQHVKKDIGRSVYTKRIVDISGKIRQQKFEIEKVLNDTRLLQKEINSLSGKLDRSFTVVEGTAYKESGGNEKARQIYRGVTSVHEKFAELISLAQKTGVVQREIFDLNEQIDVEKGKKVEAHLNQLKNDLNQIRKENVALLQQSQK